MQLASYGINPRDVRGGALIGNGSRFHVHAYTQLSITGVHMVSNLLPILSDSAKPRERLSMDRAAGRISDRAYQSQ